jgi:2-keto-4-pentenoate hydratase/ribosomal protein S18 acetylase RimI-like enzyme
VEIRPVRTDEVDEAGQLVGQAYRSHPQLADGTWLPEIVDVAARLKDAEVLVAVEDGRLLGSVTYVPGPGTPFAEFEAPDGAGMRMLGVAPEAQGRGVGEALTLACLDRARQAGRGVLILHTASFMDAAQRLYDRLGFERAEDLDWQVDATDLWGYRYWLDAASLLAHAREARRSLQPLAHHLRPATLDAGYDAQDRLAARLGLETVGWKIGATNPAVQQLLGVEEPFAGRVFAPHCQQSPTGLDFGRYVHVPALECEIGVRLGSDLDEGPFTAGSVAAAVAEVMPTIEVIEFRFADRDTAGPPSLMADNGGAADLVVGPATADWRHLDLAALPMRLVIDGKEVASGTGAAALGHPLAALAWLAQHRVDRGAPLRAGDVITTGTCTGAVPALPGSVAVHDAGPLGQVVINWA